MNAIASFFNYLWIFLRLLWESEELWLSNFLRIGLACLLLAAIVFFVLNKRRRKLLKQESDQLSLQKAAFDSRQKEQAVKSEQALQQLESRCAAIRQSKDIKRDLCWNDFEQMCHIANTNLHFLPNKLKMAGNFSEREIRLCILVVLDCSYTEMADLLQYALSGIGKLKFSTAQKLGTNVRNMRKTLLKMAVSE